MYGKILLENINSNNKPQASPLNTAVALLSSCGQESQQNSPDDADDDNIRKIPMNAVLVCLRSLDCHYRSVGQALPRGEGNQGAVHRRLSGSQQEKGPSAINQLRNIGSHASFISRSHLECARSLYSG